MKNVINEERSFHSEALVVVKSAISVCIPDVNFSVVFLKPCYDLLPLTDLNFQERPSFAFVQS